MEEVRLAELKADLTLMMERVADKQEWCYQDPLVALERKMSHAEKTN